MGTVCGKTSQGEQEKKTKKEGSKTGVKFLGLSRREIGVKFFGAVNHMPKFFAQSSRQISRKIPRPENQFFAHNFAPDFAPVLAQPAGFPLRSFGAFATQETGAPFRLRLLGTPLPTSLIACHHLEASRYHMCDQDERQRQGTMFSKQNFFRYKISRVRFCSGCGTKVLIGFGGGSADLTFMGAGDFSELIFTQTHPCDTIVSKLITDRDSFWQVISDYRYSIALPEELISIAETDLWNLKRKSLIADTASLLNSNSFPLQIQISGSKRINSVIISATTVPLPPILEHKSGKKETYKHKHFGRDSVRDKQEPSPGTNGTPPRDKLGPVLGTNRPFSVEFHSVPFVPGTGVVFLVYWVFVAPK